MVPIFLTETDLRTVTEAVRFLAQSNGDASPRAGEYAALYRNLSQASATAHRVITEHGAASVTAYNPATATVTLSLDLASIDGPPEIALRTLLTEAYETLTALVVVGPLDDESGA
jgi:hypothetical protein